jgi:hypothetical protein
LLTLAAPNGATTAREWFPATARHDTVRRLARASYFFNAGVPGVSCAGGALPASGEPK